MTFDIKKDDFYRDPTGPYRIVGNKGGGSCYFYSIIDSGIPLEIKPCNIRITLSSSSRNNPSIRKELVKLLRLLAVKRLKKRVETDKQFASVVKSVLKITNFNRWYERMLDSSYWADDFMISALSKELNFVPLLIGSKDRKIYCGTLDYNDHINLPDGSMVTYNSIEKFEDDRRPFVLIFYHWDTHFENIVYNRQSYFKNYQDIPPLLTHKIKTDCRLISHTKVRRNLAKPRSIKNE